MDPPTIMLRMVVHGTNRTLRLKDKKNDLGKTIADRETLDSLAGDRKIGTISDVALSDDSRRAYKSSFSRISVLD